MNSDRDFETTTAEWLNAGSDATPPEVIDAVLLAVRSTPQERDYRISWRTSPRKRLAYAMAAVAALVVSVAAFSALSPHIGIGPEPTPHEEPSVDLGVFEPFAGWIVYGGASGIWGIDPAAPADPPTRVQLTAEAGNPLGWSSDGTRLLIMRGSSPAAHLFVLHADGSETRVTERPMTIRGATISPDGSRVVFATIDGAGNTGFVFAVDADGGPAEVLLELDGLEGVSFSPDGTRIAYVSGHGDSSHRVSVMDADGTNPREILANDVTLAAGHDHGIAWSPAGDRIALGIEGIIYTFAPDGSGFTVALRGGGRLQPFWSPDGSQLETRGPWHPGTVVSPTVTPAPTATTGHGPSRAPSPSAAQTAAAHFQVFPGPPRPLDAGIYDLGPDNPLGPDFPVSISFVVPAGWLSCANSAGLLCLADGVGGVNIDIVTNVVADPCDETTLRDPSVGPTVDDLVIAISSLPWSGVTPPTDVTLDGIRGKEFEVTAPIRSPCAGTDEFSAWETTIGRRASVSPGERMRLRILDVQGTRVVIAGSYLPGTTSLQDLAEINAIVDSVRIEPPGG